MFVIYHIQSTMQVGPTPNGHPHTAYAKVYKSRGAAINTMMKFNYRSHMRNENSIGPYGVASIEYYNKNVVKMVERTNLISGKTFMEASNTPGYCSPSSEAYWSM